MTKANYHCNLYSLTIDSSLGGFSPTQKYVRACAVGTHSHLTPNTVKACQTLVTLDASVTTITLGGRVPLHPHMLHSLETGREKGVLKDRGDDGTRSIS